jgi:hypothetical protein
LPSEDPVAEFTASHTIATTLDFVEFFDDSSDYDGDISAWTWDFDDDTTSSLQHPAHRFLAPCDIVHPPQCHPALRSFDTEGNQASKTTSIIITPAQED